MNKQIQDIEQAERDVGQLSRDLFMAHVLQELAISLTSVSDQEQLIVDGPASAAMLLDAPQAAMLLLSADGCALEAAKSFDDRQVPGPGLWVPTGRGLIGSLAANNQQVLASDARADPRFDPEVDVIGNQLITSLAGVALIVKDQLVGALIVANRQPPFTGDDLRWLASLAAIIAAVYERSCLVEQLRGEQARLLDTQEELRRKLARDLHDGVTQRIAAAQMEIDYIRRVMRHDPSQLEREIDRLENLLTKAMKMLRTALFDLRPLILEAEGLAAALHRFVQEHSNERGPALRLHIIDSLPTIRGTAGGALFSIIQEAVNNAQKHAGAKEVTISLSEANNQLVIGVRDDGRGFNPQEVAAGYAMGSSFGMRNMRELVDAIGGTLTVWSELGRGTSITITVPWANLNSHGA
ncbi:MAG: hypothetical protein KatS3mg057_3154 [Herpetosiphonaceae bacterium]|nr:MAG: hypothetical protein KatS3mg057_3154 [Herpetosiphonaceae bacterium]